MNVTLHIAKDFLNLVDKHFPKKHKLHKIFNRNNVKVSYCCLPNFGNIINSHNKRILSDESATTSIAPTTSSTGNCLQKNVIYHCKVTTADNATVSNYIGCTENTFKYRLYKHRNSFKCKTKINSTELSKCVSEHKNNNTTPILEWSTMDQANPRGNGSKRCPLCLTEKFHIIYSKLSILNKRSELVSKCRHENKFYLSNYKDIPPDSN